MKKYILLFLIGTAVLVSCNKDKGLFGTPSANDVKQEANNIKQTGEAIEENYNNPEDNDELAYVDNDPDTPEGEYSTEATSMKVAQVYNSNFDELPTYKYASTTKKQKYGKRQLSFINKPTNFTLVGYGFGVQDSAKKYVKCYIKGVEQTGHKIVSWKEDTIVVQFPKLTYASAINQTFSIKFKVFVPNAKVGKADIGRSKARGCISATQAATVLKETGSGLDLSLKALLQGCYDETTSLMKDLLRSNNYIPLIEPYSALDGFTHTGGGGGETITATDLAVTGAKAIIDWVFVEIRAAGAPAVVLYTRSAVILADGTISKLNTSAIPKGYYSIAIRHRNHLGVMTKDPIDCNSSTTFDFTTGTNVENNAMNVLSGKYCLWSGNCLNDGKVSYGIGNNATSYTDASTIFMKLGGNISTVISGYNKEDHNMNGQVKYSGIDNDRGLILVNIGGADIYATVLEKLR
jgi:hypothetical protein